MLAVTGNKGAGNEDPPREAAKLLQYAAWLRLDARQLRCSCLTAQRSPFGSAMAWLIAFRAVTEMTLVGVVDQTHEPPCLFGVRDGNYV
jgi:hypothetical protein